MQITPEVSHRIKVLRLPLIIGIVTIHSSLVPVGYTDKFFQIFIAGTWGGSCVAFLFILSGFLFFRNFKFSLNSYLEKLKSRFWTLLVPYLFWNLALLAMVLIVLNVPATSSIIQGHYKQYIGDYSLANFIDCLTGSKSTYPIAFHFWYVRDLIAMVILSPVFLVIARKIPYLGLALFAAPWLLQWELGFINIQWLGPLFFYLGCLIAVKNWDLTKLDRHKAAIIGIYLGMAVVLTAMQTSDIQTFQHLFECCTRVAGTAAIWCASDLVGGKLQKICLNFSGLAFFVYAAHEPTVTVLKEVFERLSKPSNSLTVIIYYLLITAIATFVTLAAGTLLQKYSPKFFQLITGARG
ncbi:acyltransferase [Microcoleus sp. herbarium19]|uniref:acyltransferase n=1 Tax=unclassified Microcoleus TaxID=2642155 RepID=UPI002FD1342E